MSEETDRLAAEKYAAGLPYQYQFCALDSFLAGAKHARAEMQGKIEALQQEVAGGSWAFVKQIEELEFQIAQMRASSHKNTQEIMTDEREKGGE
jgi:hypothetical protein